MTNLCITIASDLSWAALTYYLRGKGLSQTMQDKPLLAWLNGNKKTFPGGGGTSKTVSFPVKGAYMSDSDVIQGYTGDESLDFNAGEPAQRGENNWKETHYGFWINWTELKIDGITIVEDKGGGTRVSDHADMCARITPILETYLEDFGESYSRLKNAMFWADGSQDSDQPPGITYFLDGVTGIGTKSGISRATYSWWNHRTDLALGVSGENSTLIKFLNSEILQLRRYGGKPNKALCGSEWLAAQRTELLAKGYFTQEGFQGDKATDMGMGGLHMTGLGKFEYDPTLDSMGKAKYCYIMDSRHIKLRPMEGEDDKALNPVRPYNYLVFMKSITWTGLMEMDQANAHGVYAIE